MKSSITTALILATCLSLSPAGHAQAFNAGSTGSLGALDVTANQTLDLPADGILNYTTVRVAAGVTLRFNRNALNTPVYILATGDITIDGTVDVSGSQGTTSPPLGGRGGPGGFDGGAPGVGGQPPGAGKGPGRGLGGTPDYSATGAGAGVYSPNPSITPRPGNGTPYGTPLLIPLVGGSGGGATLDQYPGGGGGGALLLASNTRILISGSGRLLARGAYGAYGSGSGGGVRLVAPSVEGTGIVSVTSETSGGPGRIRVDSYDRTNLRLTPEPDVSRVSLGSLMMVFPNPNPRLDLVQVAGTTVAEGAAGPVQVLLPFGSSPDRTIVVQARDFGSSVPIRVVLTPENGTPVTYDGSIDNAAANPATTTLNVTFPVNVLVHVHTWTR